MRALNAGPAGNGERLRLIAHLGFALFDTNRGRPSVRIRPTLRGFLLASAVERDASCLRKVAYRNGIFATLILIGFPGPTAVYQRRLAGG
jgi:hypothetical protein